MKKLIIILLLSPLFSFGQIDDKTLHMGAGHVISMGIGIATYKITKKPVLSFFVGVGAAWFAGIAKEEFDFFNGGVFNKQDMYATFWGGTVGGVFNIPIFDISEKRRKERELKLM